MPTRLILSLTCLLFAVLLWLPVPRAVDACCMVPEDYLGSVGQAEQRALMIHREGIEDLILGITYKIKPDANGELPGKLTWLIALPNEPMERGGYGLADESLFDELEELAMQMLIRRLPPPRYKGEVAAAEGVEEAAEEALDDSIELGRAVTVGPYDIQPVRGVGQNALNGLNAYLKQRGFPEEDPDHMAWFVEHGFTFLCIEVKPEPGQTTLPAGQPLPPLRVRFETEHPYYPLRYSSQQGDFTLALYTLTDKPIDLKKSAGVLDAIGWRNRPGTWVDYMRAKWKAPQPLGVLDLIRHNVAIDTVPKESQLFIAEGAAWSFGLFMGRPNPKDRPISGWTGDCFFTLKDQKVAPLGTMAKALSR
ncbi:MAG: DUF2330 domain-containing protein [Planctomycetota bacterium]